MNPASTEIAHITARRHIFRLLSHIRILSIHTSCSALHFVARRRRAAWLFDGNGSTRLGLGGSVDTMGEGQLLRIEVKELGGANKRAHAACGRNHTLFFTSGSTVWAAGTNM